MVATDTNHTIAELLQAQNYAEVKKMLETLHPADAVELLRELDEGSRAMAFRLLKKDAAVRAFEMLDVDEQRDLLRSLGGEIIGTLLNEMSPDDRTELFEELPAGVVKHYLSILSPVEREVANRLLGYHEDSAGRLMTVDLVDLREDLTAAQAIEHVRKTAPGKETVYYCYVIDSERKLMGIVSLRDLITAAPDQLVRDIARTDVVSVTTDTDQEEAARTLGEYDFLALPVVDREGMLVGIVTQDDLMDVVEEEGTEDIHLMGGVGSSVEPYFRGRLFDKIRRRIWWLLALLLLESLSSNILQSYNKTLSTVVALAFFIPMLIDTGGNAGTQSATLVIRGLATGEIKEREAMGIVGREAVSGLVMGLILGAFAFVKAYLSRVGVSVAMSVSLAMASVIFLSNIVGAVLPLVARRLKVDPAVMAGPLITTVVDVAGLLTYFEIAKWLMGLTA